MSATAIIGPPLMTNLFFYFTHDQAPFQFPGAPFFLAFIMLGMGTVIAYFNFKRNKIAEIKLKNSKVKNIFCNFDSWNLA